MAPIIKCDNVSIRYITGDFKDIGLKEYLIRRLKGEYSVTEFWADRHVTFELQPGDMLGIIGSNGAGKSTILKAISGIMVPTEGHVECNGKIAALLELASGFDGDLSVRENTYLRAAMLGYSREFVDATYDSIIDFAELRGFEDRPFKQLSSGMKSRLAFSIASLVEPEILILDEVLSVGDGAFRKKSEQKMRQIIGGGATTILVSRLGGPGAGPLQQDSVARPWQSGCFWQQRAGTVRRIPEVPRHEAPAHSRRTAAHGRRASRCRCGRAG